MKPKELKLERERLGLTQSELADLLFTPYQTYTNWECGRRRIPGILLVALKAVRFEIESKRGGKREGVERSK